MAPGEGRDTDDRPVWSRRIRSERAARRWSQSDALEALRAHAGDQQLPGRSSLLRNWKRWESGETEPDDFYKALISKTFGTVTAAFFPPSRPELESHFIAGTGLDTLEIVSRLQASDVSASIIEALRITAERLSCDYSHVQSEVLLVEGREWLRRITALRDSRLTLTQHREVLSLAGQVALLVGCVEYDMGLRQAAEATRKAALSLGAESGNSDVVGWAHEMRSWYALTQGQYRSAIVAAQAGLEAVGPAHSVVVQLAAHQAKAWARIGDRRQVEVMLNHGRDVLEGLPYPDNLDNHFVVDPSKWDFYTMDCYRHVGEDQMAATYAAAVIGSSTDPDGTVRKPMRVAEAHVTLGVVAARAGDLEKAIGEGRAALAGVRRSIPSLAMHTRELVHVLRERFPHESAVAQYEDELRALRA
ncbi:XRE family transcriptional regulator [Micromonospora sp. RTGN7]|uniref:XRE family transcriptional regulator n=1 Tax=Micromonospora sp. RTGN7 TaxID=3016526 RepID=UPI0029FECC19|nr:XRE family transcriptional regulator [Micromonospora sp. RTGN7]